MNLNDYNNPINEAITKTQSVRWKTITATIKTTKNLRRGQQQLRKLTDNNIDDQIQRNPTHWIKQRSRRKPRDKNWRRINNNAGRTHRENNDKWKGKNDQRLLNGVGRDVDAVRSWNVNGWRSQLGAQLCHFSGDRRRRRQRRRRRCRVIDSTCTSDVGCSTFSRHWIPIHDSLNTMETTLNKRKRLSPPLFFSRFFSGFFLRFLVNFSCQLSSFDKIRRRWTFFSGYPQQRSVSFRSRVVESYFGILFETPKDASVDNPDISKESFSNS